MGYWEEAEGLTLTRKQAEKLVLDHQADLPEFYAEFGNKPDYKAHAVLAWLGY
jgi:hypothetical protein